MAFRQSSMPRRRRAIATSLRPNPAIMGKSMNASAVSPGMTGWLPFSLFCFRQNPCLKRNFLRNVPSFALGPIRLLPDPEANR